jgi:hypothetical protein
MAHSSQIESAAGAGRARYGNEDTARMEGRHVRNGWPHFSSKNHNCLCSDQCCMGVNGCSCAGCAHVGHGAPSGRRRRA